MNEAAPLLSAESGNYQPGPIEDLPLNTRGKSIAVTLDIAYSEDRDWMKDGSCRNGDADPDIFFPEEGNAAAAEEAKKICLGKCAVINECREYALRRDDEGVWGGMNERERRRLKRMAS